mgnify:FL=1
MKASVIAVANNKGGVAKTTTAVNVADMLARRLIGPDGKPTGHVLLVDLDPQGNVADALGVRSQVYDEKANPNGPCVSFLLTGTKTLRESVISLDRKSDGLPRPNLFLVPATRLLESIAEELIIREFQSIRNPQNKYPPLDDVLSVRFAPALDIFRYIIIDCPPKLDTLKRAVYRFAERVIVPTKPDFLSVEGAVQHTEDLKALHDHGDVKARVAYVVPAMVHPRQVMDQQMMVALMKAYGRNRIAAPVPQSVVVKESSGRGGRTLMEYAPDSPAAQAYQHLVERGYHDR